MVNVLRKFFRVIYLMVVISFFTFSLMSLLPSDPVTMKYRSMQQQIDKRIVEAEKEKLGLNKSMPEQYLIWAKNIVKGDLGLSIRYNKPVKEKLVEALPVTLSLTFMIFSLSTIIAIPAGIFSAMKKNSIVDYLVRFLSFIGLAMPSFWLALLLIYIFSVNLRWLPVTGSKTILHFILPSLTYTI